MSGAGSAAAAKSAAILGAALAPSVDQPAVSRILAKVSDALLPASAAISENSGASWVQATVTAPPSAAILRKRSASARQSWVAVCTSAPRQARRKASPSSAMLSSQEQARIFLGLSGIHPPVIAFLAVVGLFSRPKFAAAPPPLSL